MECVKSDDQIVKERKKIQRRVDLYGFPKPTKVLMDAMFILSMHENGMEKSQISSYLEQDVKLFTTSCTLSELTLDKEGKVEQSQSLMMSRDFSVASCSHGDKGVNSRLCIQDIVGATNPESFFVATGSGKMALKLLKVPSVPVIRLRDGALRLKKPSSLQKNHALGKGLVDDVSNEALKKGSKTAGSDVKGASKRKRKSAASVSSEVPRKKSQLVDPAKPWHWAANPSLSDVDNSDDDYDPAKKKGKEMNEEKDGPKTVVVAGFTTASSFNVVRYELLQQFRSCGRITRIYITQDEITGLPKDVAFITFADRRSVYKALKKSGSQIGRGLITVEEERS